MFALENNALLQLLNDFELLFIPRSDQELEYVAYDQHNLWINGIYSMLGTVLHHSDQTLDGQIGKLVIVQIASVMDGLDDPHYELGEVDQGVLEVTILNHDLLDQLGLWLFHIGKAIFFQIDRRHVLEHQDYHWFLFVVGCFHVLCEGIQRHHHALISLHHRLQILQQLYQ